MIRHHLLRKVDLSETNIGFRVILGHTTFITHHNVAKASTFPKPALDFFIRQLGPVPNLVLADCFWMRMLSRSFVLFGLNLVFQKLPIIQTRFYTHFAKTQQPPEGNLLMLRGLTLESFCSKQPF